MGPEGQPDVVEIPLTARDGAILTDMAVRVYDAVINEPDPTLP